MRRTAAIVAVPVAIGTIAGGAVTVWRRNRRIGTTFVNSVVNPGLLRRGLAGGGISEIGAIEHLGRKSGIRRLTPVHPEATPDGFRILVPLGLDSEWARNVLAAGHCRLQVHGVVYDLGDPAMIPAGEADDLPRAVRAIMSALGFEYLRLRTFSAGPGSLEPPDGEVATDGDADPSRMPATGLVGEPTPSTT